MADMCFELLRHRRLKGWTQAELARRADLGSRTVARLERGEGQAATVETLQKLAAALDTRPARLFPELLGSSKSPAA